MLNWPKDHPVLQVEVDRSQPWLKRRPRLWVTLPKRPTREWRAARARFQEMEYEERLALVARIHVVPMRARP